MRKIIFLNGPPYSGKDTAATAICDEHGSTGPYYAREFKFSKPLKDAAQAFFSLTDSDVRYFEQRENKDEPHELLGGMSWREVQQTLSEKWAKVLIGPDAFGHLMLNQLRGSAAQLCVISDSGFEEEAWPLIKEFGINNCLNVHIVRDGTTFDGDTRSYWEIPGMTTVELDNKFELDMYQMQSIRKVNLWLRTLTN